MQVKRTIGLLFTHGIGEQKRFEHLRSSVAELAQIMLETEKDAGISVVDRTADWKVPPGQPHPKGLAPLTFTLRSADRHIVFECHEVWWADLGARSGVSDQIGFWLWSLGQWNAPIYLDLDASGLRKQKSDRSDMTKLPRSVAGKLFLEPFVRLQLMVVSLAASFVGTTWSLAKRLFCAILGKAPGPTLIVRYVGDVRTYEERASRGSSAMSDPGFPRRVAIRRRMVSEMVAMGTKRDLDGWYVLAHSLGTVVAYNGLTETGHCLPNYLSQDQWRSVPQEFKTDGGCRCRAVDEVHRMMPARPDWLDNRDVFNRPLLFEKLRGFLTYGSPLEKFAALWPRIVATATDRTDNKSVFAKHCWWINLAAPLDPVAGLLKSFATQGHEPPLPAGSVPAVTDIQTPLDLAYLISHVRYFVGVERWKRDPSTKQKRAVVKLLLCEPDPTIDPQSIKSHKPRVAERVFRIYLAYAVLFLLLWSVAAVIAGGAWLSLSTSGGPQFLTDPWGWLWQRWTLAFGRVLGVALTLILGIGIWRWLKESFLNIKLGKHDQTYDPDRNDPWKKKYWERLNRMFNGQAWTGTAMLPLLGIPVLTGLYLDFARAAALPPDISLLPGRGWYSALAAGTGILVAAILQTTVNWLGGRSKAEADTASREAPEPESV